MFKLPRDLVCKYLNELNARTLPDGSVHPDDLDEARFMAELEYLETRDELSLSNLPPDGSQDLAKQHLELKLIELAKRYAEGDTAVIDDISGELAKALLLLQSRRQNVPKNASKLPPIGELKKQMEEYEAKGIEQESSITIFSLEYGVSESAVYKKFNRAGIRLKKSGKKDKNNPLANLRIPPTLK